MNKNGYFGVGATAVFTAGLVALLLFGFRSRGPIVARYLASRTDRLSDEELTSHLRRLADLESAGIGALVDSLASGRPAEREAGLLVLEEVVAQECATNEPSPRLDRLTRELAASRDVLAEAPREAVRRWSSRIVRHQYRAGLRDPSVLAHCRRIQKAFSREDSESQPLTVVAQTAETQVIDNRIDAAANRRDSAGVVSSAGSPADSPVTFAESGSSVASEDPDKPLVEGSAPAFLPPLLDTTLLESPPLSLGPENSINVAGFVRGTLGTVVEAPRFGPAPRSVEPVENVDDSEPKSAAPTAVQVELERRPEGIGDRDLLMVLQHDDPAVSGWAEDELHNRGVGPEVISFARQIVHRDHRVRSRLVGRLPQMPTAYRTPWLLEFTHDFHPSVRLAALEIIEEFRDEPLDARVKEMAEDDRDPAVRRRARRLAERQADAESPSPPDSAEGPETIGAGKTNEALPPEPEIPAEATPEDPWE